MSSGPEQRQKSSTKPKQNYPRETFNHNSSPKSLEYDPRRLITENDNVKKTIRKEKRRRIHNKKHKYCFLTHNILKAH